MKYILTEKQHKLLIESQSPEIMIIPSFEVFGRDWDLLLKYVERKGNPPFRVDDNLELDWHKVETLGTMVSVGGDLNLYNSSIETLGNLVSVDGSLDLRRSTVSSLGNLRRVGRWMHTSSSLLRTLNKLEYVGNDLSLELTWVKSFGNLKYVGGDLILNTILNRKYSDEQIDSMIKVEGEIRL